MKRNQELQLDIESLAFGGQGVARHKDFVVFVKGAVPGDTVRARIVKKKKKHAEAVVQALLSPSPQRIEPRCPYFGSCGGCKIQSLDYEQQLYYKRQQVVDSLTRLGGLKDLEIQETLPSPDQFFYRNKMEFSFSDRRWLLPEEIASDMTIEDRDFALGFHVAGHFDKIVDLKTCFLQSETSRDIVNWVREYARTQQITPYNLHDHTGFLRFLMIREGKKTGQRMVNLVTRENRQEIMEPLTHALVDAFPDTTSVVNNIATNVSNVAFGEEEVLLHGPPFIEEHLQSWRFRISANSFFQTNSMQAERLYQLVRHLGDFRGHELVYDLYAGTGSIGIFISDAVRRVVGFECIESCIEDAYRNAQLNHVTNCEFITADLMHFADHIPANEKPDVMIIDPPRAGMHPRTVKTVLEVAPQRIIHVSCNPTTLARDLAILCESQYTIDFVQPVDMFPQTGHVELVVRLDHQ